MADRSRITTRWIYRRDLRIYYSSRYVPERKIVAIVGAVEADRALDLARAAYGDWPAAPGAVDPSPDEPPRREVRAAHSEEMSLAPSWPWAGGRYRLDPDSPSLDLAAAVLGSGRRSWLYRQLRETGVATWVSAPLRSDELG